MSNIFRKGRTMNFKLGKQTEEEDPHQRQASWLPRSKVKVTKSLDVSDRCWPISQEWNVLETPKLTGRLSTGNNAYQFQGQRSSSPGRLMLRQEIVISSEREGLRTSNLVHRRSTKTRIIDKRSGLQGQRSRSQGHVMRLTGVGR